MTSCPARPATSGSNSRSLKAVAPLIRTLLTLNFVSAPASSAGRVVLSTRNDGSGFGGTAGRFCWSSRHVVPMSGGGSAAPHASEVVSAMTPATRTAAHPIDVATLTEPIRRPVAGCRHRRVQTLRFLSVAGGVCFAIHTVPVLLLAAIPCTSPASARRWRSRRPILRARFRAAHGSARGVMIRAVAFAGSCANT